MKPSSNPLIAHIYKAGDCKDLNDIEIALAQIDKVKANLKNVRGPSRAVYIREASLRKRAKVLFEKSVRPVSGTGNPLRGTSAKWYMDIVASWEKSVRFDSSAGGLRNCPNCKEPLTHAVYIDNIVVCKGCGRSFRMNGTELDILCYGDERKLPIKIQKKIGEVIMDRIKNAWQN